MTETLTAIEQVKTTALDLAVHFGPKLLAAVVIFVVGVTVSRWAAFVLERGLARIDLEPPVRALLVRIARMIVLVLFLVMALQNVGVELLPLLAGLGVIGAGVALAMQGLLSDLAAGLSIIFAKPFRVGEYISIASEEGRVKDITLFNTVLCHPDGSQVVIPNRKIVGEIYHNYGKVRQLDLCIAVAYETDLDDTLALIHEVLRGNPRVLPDPPSVVQPVRLADCYVEISIKLWVAMQDCFAAKGEINKAVVAAFRERGIEIPFPRHDVRLLGDPLVRQVLEAQSREFEKIA